MSLASSFSAKQTIAVILLSYTNSNDGAATLGVVFEKSRKTQYEKTFRVAAKE